MKRLIIVPLLFLVACTKTVYVPTPVTFKPAPELMQPPLENEKINKDENETTNQKN